MFELTLEQLEQVQSERLSHLVTLAGNDKHLAKMLGVPVVTARGWIGRGRISRRGAELVEQHPVLSEHYGAQDLRPDLSF